MSQADGDRSTEALIVAASRLAATKAQPKGNRRRIIGAALIAALAIGGTVAVVNSRSSDTPNNGGNVSVPGVVGPLSSVGTSVDSANTASSGVDVTGGSDLAAGSTSSVPAATVPATTSTSAGSEQTTTIAPTVTEIPVTTAPTDPSAVVDPAGVVDPSSAPANYATYKDGVLYLFGAVATVEDAAQVRAQAEKILPPENIQGEFSIDPSAGGPTGIVRADSGVLFASNSSSIKASFYDDLDLVVTVLTITPEATLEVHGYTDSVGADESNLALSEARVRAITDYLAFKGVSPDRLVGVPHGELNPVGDNTTAEGRALNRRIDVVFRNLFR